MGNVIAHSQQPIQAPQIKPNQKTESRIENQKNTKQSPSPSKSTIPTKPNTGNSNKNSEHRTKEGSEFWPPLFGIRLKISDTLLVLFTLVLAIVTGGLWFSTRKMWQETKKSAQAALETAESIKLSERAYVKISHLPPGLVGVDLPEEMNRTRKGYIVNIQIKNFGRTPATVSDVVITHRVLDIDGILPRIPEYDWNPGTVGAFAFLVANDEFFRIQNVRITRDDLPDIDTFMKNIIVYGYVDYIDQFGQHHRAGYARQYDPGAATINSQGGVEGCSNLFFVSQEGYNYDRERQPGEGNDWE